MPEVFSMMDKVKINKKNREADTLFLMTIGVLLAWSIVAALINTTMFNQSHVVGLARVFVVTGVFRLALAGRTRRWISLALVVAGILFIVVGFVTYPPDYFLYEPKRANQAADFIRRTIRYINGNEIFRQSYETAMIWAMSIIAGLFVTIFGYFYFKFLVLFLVPAATFGILLISRFFDLRISFFVFIFCSVAYLVKHLNQKCGDKSKGKASFASYALFVAIFCVGIAAIMPVPGARFRHNLTQTAVSRPFHHVNDTIYFAFGPRYFALGQVGFGGSGQLGGDIVRNERLIMRLRADREAMPIYLTGAILDTYTGSWWLNSFWERTPVDFGEMQQNIDLYERATSQMTAWMLHAPIANVMDDVSYLALARVRQREAILADLESGLNLGVDLWGAVLPDFDAEFVQASLVEVIIENIELVTSGGSGLGFNINWDNLPASDLEVIIADLGTVINLYTNEGVLSELYFVLDFRPGIGVMGSDFLFLSARARPIERRVRTLAETEHFYLDIGEDMFTTRTMDIDILNYRTFSVFYAGILQDIASSNPNVNFFRDRNGRIVAHERMPRNTVYTVQFSDLNDFFDDESDEYNPGAFPWSGYSNMLRYSYRGVLRDISGSLAQQRLIFGQGLAHVTIRHNGIMRTYEDLLNNYLIPRADWIHETFTALPADFPERIRDLAVSITAEAANDYERARLLERYLSENFEYTLLPGNPPEDRDFVDHFLFDLQEGYCTYFATAFVTMARSLGLPARYVEGFMVRGIPDESGFYRVLNTMGHAWGEVYFEGFGWHRFEPTPAAGLPMPYISAGHEGSWNMSDLDDDLWNLMYLEHLELIGAGTARDPAAGGQQQQPPPQQQQAAGAVIPQNRLSVYVIIAIALLVLAVGALTIKALRIYRQALQAKQKADNAAVQHYFGVLLKYMKFFGYEIRDNETADQFAARVGDKVKIGDKVLRLKDIAEIFSKARYSQHPVSSAEREMVEAAVRDLDIKMRSSVNMGMHLYYKYIKAIV